MTGKVKIRIIVVPDYGAHRFAVVYRDVDYPYKSVRREVLSDRGRWREKAEADVIFDDEKILIEEVK